MLTVDLLRLRASGTEIRPVRTKPERALPLAEALLEVFRSSTGKTLEALEAEIGTVTVAATDVKVRQGLAKLLKDDLELSVTSSEETASIRARVFALAAEERKASSFDREKVLATIGAELGRSPKELDQNLFCDLRGETRVISAPLPTADVLLERYERAQEDALLMRATVVKATIPKVAPATFRAIFRKLKFLGLLFRVHRRDPEADEGFTLTIDGPSSLFGPTTRYGISFVHLLPTLRLAGGVSLTAEIRYRNRTYVFRKEESDANTRADASEWLADVPATLLRALERATKGSDASTGVCHEILENAGEVLVPDLVVSVARKLVYVEVLGKHDRSAFFRRLELASRASSSMGSPEAPLILCVPKALRIDPDLAKDVKNTLSVIVFHGQPSATAVLERARKFYA